MRTLPTQKESLFTHVVYAAVLVCAVIGGLFLLPHTFQPLPDLDEFLPDNTLAFVQVKNFAKTATVFKNSPFGQELVAPTLERALDQLEVEQDLKRDLLTFIGLFDHAVEHPLFKTVLNKQSALAVLPPKTQYNDAKAFLKDNLIFITQIKTSLSTIVAPESLLRKALPAGMQVQHTPYKKTTITTLELNHQKRIYFGIIEQTLIVALDSHPIKRCIEFAKNRLLRSGITLHHQSEYRTLLEDAHSNPDMVLYAHLPAAFQVLSRFDHTFPSGVHLDKQERLLLSMQNNNEHHQIRLVLKHFTQRASNIIDHFQLAAPVKAPHLNTIASGASVYFWTNWLDFSKLWRIHSMAPDLKTAPLMFSIAQKIYEHTGVDIYTFVDLFGAEFGFFLQNIPKQSFTTIPTVCFQIQLRDPERVEQLLSTLLKDIPTRTTQLNETTKAVSLIMAGGLIQPAYVIQGDWFFLADTTSQLQQLFTHAGPRLITDQPFTMVSKGFQQPNNLLLYARIDNINHGLRDLFSWGIEAMLHTQKLSKQQAEVLTRRVIRPVFNGLEGVQSQGIRIFTKKDDVRMELELYTPQKN